MRRLINLIVIVCLCAFIPCCKKDDPCQGRIDKETHIRYGFMDFGGQKRPFKFYDSLETPGYIKSFPSELIKGKVNAEVLKNWDIEYQVYTSIEDAELAMVERLDNSNLFSNNIIDRPLCKGQIGDNCWYQELVGLIIFIRNNVLVSINPVYSPAPDASIFEWLARQVDKALVSCEKVYDPGLLNSPIIHSVDVISEIPKNWGDYVIIQVNATDPDSEQLYFRKYWSDFMHISQTGRLEFTLFQHVVLNVDSSTARVKFWVWNEDYVTSSGHVEFINLKPSIP